MQNSAQTRNKAENVLDKDFQNIINDVKNIEMTQFEVISHTVAKQVSLYYNIYKNMKWIGRRRGMIMLNIEQVNTSKSRIGISLIVLVITIIVIIVLARCSNT